MAKSKSKAVTKMTTETRGQLSSNARTKAQKKKNNDCGADLGKSTTPPTLSGGGRGGIRST